MTTETVGKKPQNSNDEISFKEVLLGSIKWYEYLKSKWLLIIAFGLLGALLGLSYAYLKKPVYKATTTFVLENGDSGPGLGQYAGLASMVGIDLGNGGGLFQGDNILELYRSRRMIEKALLTEVTIDGKNQLLIDRYIKINNLREAWKANPLLRDLSFVKVDSNKDAKHSRLQDSIIGTVVNNINKYYLNVSKPDKKLSLIQADVISEDDSFAKNFNVLIVKNVNDFYIQTKTKKSLENVAILQHKTDSVRAVMNGAIYSAAAVADATPNINPSKQIMRVAPMKRSEFNAETNRAVLSELIKNLEMSKIAYVKETPLIQVIDEPVFPLEKIKTGKLKSMIVGSILAGFITVFFLILRKVIREVLLN
jgi:hypothetical protein